MQDQAPEKWSKGAVRARLESLCPHLEDQDLFMLTTTAYIMYVEGRIEGIESASKIWSESHKAAREASHV